MGQPHAVQNLGNLPPVVGLVQEQKFEGRSRRGVPKVSDRNLFRQVPINIIDFLEIFRDKTTWPKKK